ncbi:hypothetical protein HK098_008073 [Nowakowskiella sp. JEL0407]|nr:hypothetical protein HK098_008073 [Nowakowskiella sp. JEL0407]
MPLVIISGFPSSGKTTRALELQTYLLDYLNTANAENSQTQRKVIIVNEESVGIDRTVVYKSATTEKNARALIMSAVERFLTKEDIVICDYMNYIKGFRYQLYCVARSLGTPSCCLHCGITQDQALEFNTLKPSPYTEETLKDLITRFEEPDPKSRWDSPLYTVIPSDRAFTSFPISNALNLQKPTTISSSLPTLDNSDIGAHIVSSLLLRSPVKPNLSTVVKPLTETNYVHDMDVALTSIINAVLEAHKLLGDGGGMGGASAREVKVPHSDIKVKLPMRNITVAEMRRLKKQYAGINKMHTVTDVNKAADLFVEFLNRTL